MKTALIDGDIFIYAAASANEYETQWDTWQWTLHADLNASIAQFNDTLDTIVEDLQADKVVVALSDDTNWRKSVLPTYKYNRVTKRKPVVYQAMREYVRETRETYQRPGLEGDDILGILSTHKTLITGEKIIVSLDKDMQTIPGLLLNDGKARKAMSADQSVSYVDFVQEVTEAQADYRHLFQTLTGDVTDGYPGCPGIGPVKAEKILGTLTGADAWKAVVAAYIKAGLSEEVALQNARVARICRASDYDFKEKKVKQWVPNTLR